MTQGFSESFGDINACVCVRARMASLRPLEDASDGAADQQAELLGEKHPRYLTQR